MGVRDGGRKKGKKTERGGEKAEGRRKSLQCTLPLQVFGSKFSKCWGAWQVRINQTRGPTRQHETEGRGPEQVLLDIWNL